MSVLAALACLCTVAYCLSADAPAEYVGSPNYIRATCDVETAERIRDYLSVGARWFTEEQDGRVIRFAALV